MPMTIGLPTSVASSSQKTGERRPSAPSWPSIAAIGHARTDVCLAAVEKEITQDQHDGGGARS